MGVRYTSPDGTITVERNTHVMCELAIRNAGYDPAGWTIELTPITDGDVSLSNRAGRTTVSFPDWIAGHRDYMIPPARRGQDRHPRHEPAGAVLTTLRRALKVRCVQQVLPDAHLYVKCSITCFDNTPLAKGSESFVDRPCGSADSPSHLTLVLGEPWPGVPARGRGAHGRATACWLPIARGLTPHGLRHSHRTVLEELGTPPVLADERMGHTDGSVQRRYTHITAAMRHSLKV